MDTESNLFGVEAEDLGRAFVIDFFDLLDLKKAVAGTFIEKNFHDLKVCVLAASFYRELHDCSYVIETLENGQRLT